MDDGVHACLLRSMTKHSALSYYLAGCSRDVFVSRNRSLLPLDDITVLQGAAGDMGFSFEQIVSPLSNEFWCANATAGNYVNMTFTQPVVVEGIISSGAFTLGTTNVLHYVSNFSILFSRDINGQLELYNRVCWSDNKAFPVNCNNHY